MALGASGAETVRLDGQSVAVFNLAGSIRIEPGAAVASADVELHGPDAQKLTIDTLTTTVRGERATALVIRYPDDDVVYSGVRWRGHTHVKVASDGTFHRERGKRIRLRSSGAGTQAYADVVLRLPDGYSASAYLAAGDMEVADVYADLYLDTHHGAIVVERVRGNVIADTGSGNVRMDNVEGERINADTGSGNVLLATVSAQRLDADTGSGDVTLRDVRAQQLLADTGSGDIRLEYAGGDGRVSLDTGSGDVHVRLPASVGVELDVDTGSGRIASGLQGMDVLERDADKFIARRGAGELRLSVDTGSGDVRLEE